MTGSGRSYSIGSGDHPARGRLIVVSGPSGVGKGTLIRRLAEVEDFHLSVSATTRDERPGEQDGVDYYFLDRSDFEDWIEAGRFLEWAEYAGNLYGTPRAVVDRQLYQGHDVVLEIEVQGAMQIMEQMPDAEFVFVAPPSMEELEARLLGRGDTINTADRLDTARREMEHSERFDHFVVNDELYTAVGELRSILFPPEVSPDDQPAD